MTSFSRPAAVSSFTFIEILVAAMILSISVAMVMSIIGAARARILRAERVWGREHLLSNAAEFYLLAGADESLPDGLLPDGFSAECTIAPAEDLPESAAEGISGWPGWQLGRCHVRVYDVRRNLLAETVVEKVMREEDLD